VRVSESERERVCVCVVILMVPGEPTGWRRPRGYHKLQIISRKRATNSRALLRKMTYEYKASYGSSPPCIISQLYSHCIHNTDAVSS